VVREPQKVVSNRGKIKLRDKDVRAAIHRHLVPILIGGAPSRVLDEFSLCNGESRIDVAIINGKLHGVEIKSDADSLERLDRQIETYGRVFDTVTIVCGHNHLLAVQHRVPEWWGIYCATADQVENVRLVKIKSGTFNDMVDAHSVVQFLWKKEIVLLLEAAGCGKGASRKPCRGLWPELAAAYPLENLKAAVREVLRNRDDWRPDPLQT
jgi:hypothetical protein